MQCFGYYRAQRSWGTVIFSQVCVILFTGVGVCLSACWDTTTTPPQSRSPQKQTPRTPGADTPLRTDIPPEQTPPGADTPLGANPPRTRPPWYRACWEIRSTRGRCTSYWNAIFVKRMCKVLRDFFVQAKHITYLVMQGTHPPRPIFLFPSHGPPCGRTDTAENATFPQLRYRTVIVIF